MIDLDVELNWIKVAVAVGVLILTSIKVVFHPIAKGAKHPDAAVFSVKLAKADLDKLKKAF